MNSSLQEVSIVPKRCEDDHHALFVLSGVQESLHRDVLARQNIAIATKSQITNLCGPRYLQSSEPFKQSRKAA